MKRMTLSLFLGEFHEGTVNRILHLLGFTVLTIGVWQMNWLLIIVAMIVQETGHIYNHSMHKRKRSFELSDIVQWQVIAGGVALLLYATAMLVMKKIVYGNY